MASENRCPPVAVFGFIRPECLSKVFDCVRSVKPAQLFLVLDAPRVNRPDDIPKWEACKRVFEGVDWECEVHREYAQTNMGCRRRMGSGITWVFSHVEEAVVLEDDCVPDPTFFLFCAELLQRYRADARVGMIAGHVAHLGKIDVLESYYFDRLNTIWGWATWRRAWSKFDATMEAWPSFRANRGLSELCRSRYQERKLVSMFDGVHQNKRSSWATAWALTCIREGFFCLHPTRNLITNIGCGLDATHTDCSSTPWSGRPLQPIKFPLAHPADVGLNRNEEQKTIKCLYAVPLSVRVWERVKRYIKKARGGVG